MESTNQMAVLLSEFLRAIEGLPPHIKDAWVRNPVELYDSLTDTLDPLKCGRRMIPMRSSGERSAPNHLGLYEHDPLGGEIYTVGRFSLINQITIGIISPRLFLSEVRVTQELVRGVAARWGWIAPPVETGQLIAENLSPQILELLGLQSVLVMHDPVVQSDGFTETPMLLWLRRACPSDGSEAEADMPDESCADAYPLYQSGNTHLPDYAAFLFVVPDGV
jgi:hypothetical protein